MKKSIYAAILGIALVIGCYPIMTDRLMPQIPSESAPSPEVYFCPGENCSSVLEDKISDAEESVHCALYDLDLPELIEALEKKSKTLDVKLVVDNDNFEQVEHLSFARQDTSSQLSHNKFCVIDGQIVTTGSFNPTFNGNYRNNNNLAVFYSRYLAENYEDEFDELWGGVFGRGEDVRYPQIIINNKTMENYFCPEDRCAQQVIEEINNAKESIHFMTFSFTHDGIGDAIIQRSRSDGIEVKGVFEKTQNNAYNEYQKMLDAGMDVMWDHNPYKMHHKVFIIDNETVITGSFNPTKNGNENNDENMLIIHDKDIAKNFLEEFGKV